MNIANLYNKGSMQNYSNPLLMRWGYNIASI